MSRGGGRGGGVPVPLVPSRHLNPQGFLKKKYFIHLQLKPFGKSLPSQHFMQEDLLSVLENDPEGFR